jgi:prevent-host-death family protein
MPVEVGAFEAKTQLSKLLELVRKGERVIITKHGVPIAQLMSPGPDRSREPAEIIAELRKIRQKTKPGTESIRSLREAGRRL